MEPKFHYHVHQDLPMVHILNQVSPHQTLPFSWRRPILMLFSCSVPGVPSAPIFRLLYQNPCLLSRTWHSSRTYWPYLIWSPQYYFASSSRDYATSPVSCYFLPLSHHIDSSLPFSVRSLVWGTPFYRVIRWFVRSYFTHSPACLQSDDVPPNILTRCTRFWNLLVHKSDVSSSTAIGYTWQVWSSRHAHICL